MPFAPRSTGDVFSLGCFRWPLLPGWASPRPECNEVAEHIGSRMILGILGLSFTTVRVGGMAGSCRWYVGGMGFPCQLAKWAM
jgi:hypothetical protein